MEIVNDEVITIISPCESIVTIIVSISSISLSCIELMDNEPEIFPDGIIKADSELM